MKKFLSILLSFLVLFFLFYSQALAKKENTAINDLTEWQWVSLIQLIATPEKYDGHVVLINGYVNLEFEGNAIYLSKEDCNHLITKNALLIDVDYKSKDNQKFNKRYCLIVGTFDSKAIDGFSGRIKEITRMEISK